MRKHRVKNSYIWITEEWLIILISILLLLAIAIGAAGARTLVQPSTQLKPATQQVMGATTPSDDLPL